MLMLYVSLCLLHVVHMKVMLLYTPKVMIGTGYSTVAQASSVHCLHNRLWTCSYAAGRHTTPQSTTLGLHPVIHVPNYMDYYSFTDPWGMDGWVGQGTWQCSPIYYYIRLQCTWMWETCPRLFLHGSDLAGNRTWHLRYASPMPYQ